MVALWLPFWPVERHIRALKNKGLAPPAGPFALTQPVQGAERIWAVGPQAAALGLRAGQPLADARALVPVLETASADPLADQAVLTELAHWATRWTPWAATDGEDGLILDISGVAHLFGGEGALLAAMTARFEALGLTARAAAAWGAGAAWGQARYGPSADVAALPLEALRLEDAMAADLKRLGLISVGDVAGLPRAPLARRFGAKLLFRLDLFFGRASQPITPLAPPPAFRVRLNLPEPIAREDDIMAGTARLAAALTQQLDQAGQGVRRLALILYRVDGHTIRVMVGTAFPSRDPIHLTGLFADRLGPAGTEKEAGFGYETLVLAAEVTEPLGARQLMGLSLERGLGASPDPLELGLLADRLGNRLGLSQIGRLTPRASHVPEKAVIFTPMAGAKAETHDWREEEYRTLGRPLRLLPCPEPAEVMADVPDGPPARFRWRRVLYRVARSEGPERLAPEWWRVPPGAALPPTRDYFQVEDGEGRRFWLYRDGLYSETATPRWYVHGVFA